MKLRWLTVIVVLLTGWAVAMFVQPVGAEERPCAMRWCRCYGWCPPEEPGCALRWKPNPNPPYGGWWYCGCH